MTDPKPITKDVTVEMEQDRDGTKWWIIRCACHAYRYARRSTIQEAKTTCKEQGWRIVE